MTPALHSPSDIRSDSSPHDDNRLRSFSTFEKLLGPVIFVPAMHVSADFYCRGPFTGFSGL
jgi:hypothetical protein